MKHFTFTLIAFVFSFTLTAQPWRNAQGFTPGAKIALHRVWGEGMGFETPEQTAHAADSIFRHGNFISKRVVNSGVTATGTIKKLTTGTQSITYLGTVDATLLGGPNGYTAKLYLKADCGNLDWVFVEPTPEPPAPVIRRETIIHRDTVEETIVVKPMTIKLELCTASYIHGHFQQVFHHGVQEVTLTQLPLPGQLIQGREFVLEIPQTIRACNGAITRSDFFWMTAN